ncbi:MAG TPA: MEDS domain-containing protein [Candidatus Aquilonibacter sp.]|nr:MEDS domain-containing protein [Candidatus Aquilonibacter sp.]
MNFGPSSHCARVPALPAALLAFEGQPVEHAAFFYLNEESLIYTLRDVTVAALRSDGAAVIMAVGPHLRALARLLTDRGADLPALRTQGRYAEIDVEEVLSTCMEGSTLNLQKLGSQLGGAIAAARQEPNSKTAPLFVLGETVALLWARRDFRNLRALEELGDNLGPAVATLCAYPIEEFAEPGTERTYLEICAMHSTVIPPEGYPTNEMERRLREATAQAYGQAAGPRDL